LLKAVEVPKEEVAVKVAAAAAVIVVEVVEVAEVAEVRVAVVALERYLEEAVVHFLNLKQALCPALDPTTSHQEAKDTQEAATAITILP
jgi:hypothetical protein